MAADCLASLLHPPDAEVRQHAALQDGRDHVRRAAAAVAAAAEAEPITVRRALLVDLGTTLRRVGAELERLER